MLIGSILSGIAVGLIHQLLYPVILKRETRELRKWGVSQGHISTRAHWIAGLLGFFPVAFLDVIYFSMFYFPNNYYTESILYIPIYHGF